MNKETIVWINTVSFFIGWVVIMLAGADFPPPVGFIWVVALIAILDFVQYKYYPYFFNEMSKNRKISFKKNMIFFVVGGLIVSLFTLVARLDVTLQVGSINNLIWVCVVTTVGILYGIWFWIVNFLLLRLIKR